MLGLRLPLVGIALVPLHVFGGPICPLLDPPPAHTICSGNVTFRHGPPALYKGYYTTDFTKCENNCLSSASCAGFYIVPSSQVPCRIATYNYMPVNYKWFKPDPEGYVARSRGCYDCSAFCPNNPGIPSSNTSNIVVNSGFESGQIDPWVVQTPGIAEVASPGRNSQHAFYYQPDPSAHGKEDASIYQYILPCRHTMYKLTFDINVTYPENETVYVDVYYGAGDVSFSNLPRLPNNSWYTIIAYFKLLREGDTSHAAVQWNNTYSIALDNFKAVAIVEPYKLAPGAQNLLQNGGFEDGSLEPWFTYHGIHCALVSPGINSTTAVECKTALSYIELAQNITVPTGIGHLFSIDHHSSYHVPSICYVSVGVFSIFQFIIPGPGYRYFQRPFAIPGRYVGDENVSVLNLRCVFEEFPHPLEGAFIFDNIRIIQIEN